MAESESKAGLAVTGRNLQRIGRREAAVRQSLSELAKELHRRHQPLVELGELFGNRFPHWRSASNGLPTLPQRSSNASRSNEIHFLLPLP